MMEKVAKKQQSGELARFLPVPSEGKNVDFHGHCSAHFAATASFCSTDPLIFTASLSRSKTITVRIFLNGKLTNSDY